MSVPERVLITGAGGFVGAHVAADFLKDGYDVHVTSRSNKIPSRIELLCHDARLIKVHECDISIYEDVETAMQRIKPSIIVHCAAYGVYPKENDADRAVMTNVVGTLNILRAAKRSGVARVINIGSSSEYGIQAHPMREDDIPNPTGPYAVTKLTQSYLASAFANQEDLSVITLRLFSVYGVLEAKGRLFADVMNALIHDELLQLGDPTAERDFIYIADVVSAIRKACSAKNASGEIYNIGSGVSTDIQSVVDIVKRVSGHTIPLAWGNQNHKRQRVSTIWVADNTLARTGLDWQPKYSVECGVCDMLSWHAFHPNVI